MAAASGKTSWPTPLNPSWVPSIWIPALKPHGPGCEVTSDRRLSGLCSSATIQTPRDSCRKSASDWVLWLPSMPSWRPMDRIMRGSSLRKSLGIGYHLDAGSDRPKRRRKAPQRVTPSIKRISKHVCVQPPLPDWQQAVNSRPNKPAPGVPTGHKPKLLAGRHRLSAFLLRGQSNVEPCCHGHGTGLFQFFTPPTAKAYVVLKFFFLRGVCTTRQPEAKATPLAACAAQRPAAR